MKNLKLISLACGLSLALAGCAQTTTPVAQTVTTPVTQNTPVDQTVTPSLKDKIENLTNYSLVTDQQEKSQIVSVCDDFTKAYESSLEKGDVKKLYLYESKNHLFDLTLYAVQSYGLTDKDLDKVSKCGELGSNRALKLVSGNILWGYASCSGGAVPGKNDVGYDDYQACTVVEKQLADYLK